MMGSFSKEKRLEDYADFQFLLKTKEWSLWVDFLKVRKVRLQKEVNAYIESGEMMGAKIAKALMDDCDKQIKLFTQFHDKQKESE